MPKITKSTSRINNNVCLEYKKKCAEYEHSERGRLYCVRYTNKCVRSENQWREITTYTKGEVEKNPVMSVEELQDFTLNSLSIKSKYDKCNLKLFKTTFENKVIRISLKNLDHCKVLSNEDTTSVTILNNNPVTHHMYTGQDVVNWRGQTLESSKLVPFEAKISVSLEVKSLSSKIIN